MAEAQNNPGGWGAAFSVVLFILTALICIPVLILFGIGVYQYAFKGTFVDYQRNLLQSQDSAWLILLFLVPIVIQSAALIAMFARLHRDRSLTTHYAFCMIIMFSCPLSYCLLWVCYMGTLQSWAILSYVALGAIGFSLLPVIVMTYAIMWTPPRKQISDIKEDDFTDWSGFCKKLKKDGAKFGSYRRRILESLDNALQSRLMHAEVESDYDAISKSDLVGNLNRILRNPDLHLAINFNNNEILPEARELLIRGRRNLTAGEVQRLHRLLLEASFLGLIRSSEPTHGSWFKRQLRRILPTWDDFLFDIKEGITKAHFWVLANFFAVFLGVAFLFGFAFAFHDQNAIAQQAESHLYMAKSLPTRNRSQQLETPTSAAQPFAAPIQYTLYFDSTSAHPALREHPEFNDKAYLPDASQDPRKDWKDAINYSRIERITDDILKLTSKGEKLRVQLVGSTDFCDLQAAPYSSNYELSEARARNIEYLLANRLIEKDNRQRDIEWFSLPVSSEGSPLSPRSGANIPKINCEEQSHPRRSPQKKGTAVTTAIAPLENQKNTLIMLKQLTLSDVNNLKNKVDELEDIVRANNLDLGAVKDPLGRIDALTNATIAMRDNERAGINDKTPELAKDLKRKEVELKESLDAFRYIDENSGKRVVVVSFVPVPESRWFIPLSLMDYMTITTIGYGDIVPTSTFAKFLSSSANILEVFFLVVFFNALLSVKGERLSRASDKR